MIIYVFFCRNFFVIEIFLGYEGVKCGCKMNVRRLFYWGGWGAGGKVLGI